MWYDVEMKIISIANHKGGTGKTSLAWNVASLLAQEHQLRVLVLDIDPQSSLTESVLDSKERPHIGDVLGDSAIGKLSLREIIRPLSENLAIAPSDISLANHEMGLIQRVGRENILKRVLASVQNQYDIVLIDCPPSLNLLVVNALNASQGVIIPTRPEPTDLRGTRLFLKSVEAIRSNPELNPNLTVLGVVPTMVDLRLLLHQAALEDLQSAEVPVWDVIGRTVKVGEGMLNGVALHNYDPQNPNVVGFRGIAKKVTQWLRKS